jgi:hypothetical protein
MELKKLLTSETTESNLQKISIPCTPSQAARYRELSDRMRDRKKLRLLTDEARRRIDAMMAEFEEALEESGLGSNA